MPHELVKTQYLSMFFKSRFEKVILKEFESFSLTSRHCQTYTALANKNDKELENVKGRVRDVLARGIKKNNLSSLICTKTLRKNHSKFKVELG